VQSKVGENMRGLLAVIVLALVLQAREVALETGIRN
jgi:hypothetical protein